MKDHPPNVINFPTEKRVREGAYPSQWEDPGGSCLSLVQKTTKAVGGCAVAAKRLFNTPSVQVVLAFGSFTFLLFLIVFGFGLLL